MDMQNEKPFEIKSLIPGISGFFYRTKFVDFLTNKGGHDLRNCEKSTIP